MSTSRSGCKKRDCPSGCPLSHAHDLRDDAPNLSGIAGLGHPQSAAPLQERLAFEIQGIAGEKNDPWAHGGRLTRQDIVEVWPVEVRHTEITENQVVGMLAQPFQ